MQRVIFLTLSLAAGAASMQALAGPQCTEEPQDKWQNQESFQEKLKADGYEIRKFKVTKGNCYEIYGLDKEGRKVEIYFNPVDGSIVKQEIDE